MTSSYTSRAADLLLLLELLLSYDWNKFLRTLSKDIEKSSHFLSRFALVHLVGPLGAADYPLPSLILISYSLDMVVTKRIAYNKKNFHLQIGSYKCQYLGALGPNRHWTHPLVTSSPSNFFYFRTYEVSRWVESLSDVILVWSCHALL